MPRNRAAAQIAGRIGGLTNAALAPDLSEHTRPAREARFQRYVDQVKAALPGLADESEIRQRAERLRKADMHRLALRSVIARDRAAEAVRALAEMEDAASSSDGA